MTREEQSSRWFRVQPIGYVRRPGLRSLIPRRSTIPGPRPRSRSCLAGRTRSPASRSTATSSSSSGSTAPAGRESRAPRCQRGAQGCRRWDCLRLVPRAVRTRSASARHDCSAAQVAPSGSVASTPGPVPRFSISRAMRHATIYVRTQPFQTGWKLSGQRTTRSEVDEAPPDFRESRGHP